MRILRSAATSIVIVVALGVATSCRVAAQAAPVPSPSPVAAAGPCDDPALASIAVRPGLGRAPATGGAVCVAPPGAFVVGLGYRDQTTTGGGRQRLVVTPQPVVLVGLFKNNELIVAPSLAYSWRSGTSGLGFASVSGVQDAGIGFQHLLQDRPWSQSAVEIFATLPTGYPTGPSGFSIGFPTYLVSYTIAFALSTKVGFATSQGVAVSSGANRAGNVQRYVAYQPSGNLSYAVSPNVSLLLEDQIAAPTGPQAPTGNRALLGLQGTLSPNAIVDVEYELNLLPSSGVRQHSLGGGITLRL